MSNGIGNITGKPEILAPAGDEDCFLAALAAGADAIYVGLKQFSARMKAENFHMEQLARLTELAHSFQRRVYVALNTLVKPNELTLAWRLCRRLVTQTGVDGLIIQDLALIDLARQAGFGGMIAFSTLANVSFPEGLEAARRLGASRVILPRELSLDEMRVMGESCPQGLGLECFVHGALCYCVSGRCYWSSYLGGKSGLRGRCVQPCRRQYTRRNGRGGRLFSCQDLEAATVTKALLKVPNLVSWKIEGRKKGPHYVFHTVTAYRILRDGGDDAQSRDMAQEILKLALGRTGSKARLGKGSVKSPTGSQTGSGLLVGKITISPNGMSVLRPTHELLARDLLRVGTEDEKWHATVPVSRGLRKGAALVLPLATRPKAGAPVFLIDRRAPELERILSEWRARLARIPEKKLDEKAGSPRLPAPCRSARRHDMTVSRKSDRQHDTTAIWLNPRSLPKKGIVSRIFWLPPVIWPEEQQIFQAASKSLWQAGARHFVLNAPWQRALFPAKLPKEADLIGGPFCNIANGPAVEILREMGFSAAFASPELSARDLGALPAQSPLPLGLIIGGYWPLGISRFGLKGVNVDEPFQSAHGETFWARNYGGNIWIYPSWPLDLREKRRELVKMGYSFFAIMEEAPPEGMAKGTRPGLFNWKLHLM